MADLTESTPLLSNSSTAIKNTDRRQHIACAAILIAEGLERLAFHSLAGNLVFFLTNAPLCWEPSLATVAQLVLTGCMFLIGLFAGWISDSHLGRYYTIIGGYILYAIGYAYLPVMGHFLKTNYVKDNITAEGTVCESHLVITPSTCSDSIDLPNAQCSTSLFCFLVLVGLGAGIVRTNLAPFGGDQVRSGGVKETTKFFSQFYWSINAGTVVAFTVVVYFQQFYGFFIGYLVPAVALLLSFIVFVSASKFYVRRESKHRMFSTIYQMYKNAKTTDNNRSQMEQAPPSFIDNAKREFGGEFDSRQVDDVKNLWRVCAVFLLMIPYWICYSQMSGNMFLLQGLHMRLDFEEGSELCPCPHKKRSFPMEDICANSSAMYNKTDPVDDHFERPAVPAAMLQLFNVVFIIITLPFTQTLYKSLSKCGIAVYTWRRLLFGMFLAILALIAGGVLENARLRDMEECGYHRQRIGNSTYDSAPQTSIWYQIPQYSLMGASEVFTIVTGIEYAYMMAPKAMQGIIMGLFWASAGLGDFIAVAVPYIFHAIPNSIVWPDMMFINCNRLDLYLFAIAGFLFISTIVFYIVVKFVDLGLHKVVIEKPALVTESVSTPQLLRKNLNDSSRFASSRRFNASNDNHDDQ